MVSVITDSGACLNKKGGIPKNITVCPFHIKVNDQDYLDNDTMETSRVREVIAGGYVPRTYAPSVQDYLDAFEVAKDDETIAITTADGLSASYANAVEACDKASNKDRITVVNSLTLGSGLEYLVRQAADMAEDGANAHAILEMLAATIPGICTFIIPEDMDYVRRGGRLIRFDSLYRISRTIPLLEQTADGKRLGFHAIHRTIEKTTTDIMASFKGLGVGNDGGSEWNVYIQHDDNPKRVRVIRTAVHEAFPNAGVSMMPLTPAFIVQGGPHCVAVQAVHRCDGNG